MGFVVIQAIYFFIPSYIANAIPVLLAKLKVMEFLNISIDLGKTYRGDPLFGSTKTYRGIVGCVAGGVFIVFIQSLLYKIEFFAELSIINYELPGVLILGFLFGLGEGLGDLIKSFIKRRLHISSSAPFIPFDQLSYLGSLLLSFLYFVPSIEIIVAILILSPIVPILANIVAYKLKWKDVWW
jgi:CDP-2,3-bis-(O-geranylgeranyl)-sn-glycerol synthase